VNATSLVKIETRPGIDEGSRILNVGIENRDIGLVYSAGIDHTAKPFAEVVNELAVTAVHVEPAYSLAKPRVLVELVGPDILKAQIGFISGYFILRHRRDGE
jgi:hypothetical protein